MGFEDIPTLLQYAIAFGVVLGVGPAVFFVTWLYLRGWAKKINSNSDDIAKIEALRVEMQKGFDAKLEKEISEVKEAAKVQREIDQAEFNKQLQAVADNFADKKTDLKKVIADKDTQILSEKTRADDAETERDELKETIKNLNDSIDEIRGQLRGHTEEIKGLRGTIEEKDKKEKEQEGLIKAYKGQVAVLSDEKQVWVAEKALVIEIMQALGQKLKAIEEQESPTKTEEINPA